MKLLDHKELEYHVGEYVIMWDRDYEILTLGRMVEPYNSSEDSGILNSVTYEREWEFEDDTSPYPPSKLHINEYSDTTTSYANENGAIPILTGDLVYLLTEDEILNNILIGSI